MMKKNLWKSPIVLSFCQNVGRKTPEKAVELVCGQLLRRLKREKRKTEPPFQSEKYEFAALIGAKVFENEILVDGDLSIFGNNLLIQVKESSSQARKSFSVCHEVGHYEILSRAAGTRSLEGLLQFVWKYRTGREEERLSDRFAVNLLMPRRPFKERASTREPGLSSLISIANQFGTSVEATASRIIELNLWKCQVLWCHPEKMLGGNWAIKIRKARHSKRLTIPPVGRQDEYYKYGANAVRISFETGTEAESVIPGPQTNGNSPRWRIECFPQLAGREKKRARFVNPTA